MKNYALTPAILALIGLSACGKKSSDTEATTALTTGTTRTVAANAAVQATTVAELGLTGALKIQLPDAIQKQTTLRLVGEKSIEACMMRESASQLVSQIKQATSFLCHIEAEGTNIPWNTPVLLDFSEMALQAPGEMAMPTLGVYVKETETGAVEVYVCEGESESKLSLNQAFKVTGNKKATIAGKQVDVSKGTVNFSMNFDMDTEGMGYSSSFKGAMGFDDNYTDADVSGLSMEMKFSMTQSAGGISSSNTFAQKFTIASSKAKTKLGISELGSFKSGAEAFEFKKTALGVFDDTHGNVLFRYDVGVAELDFSSQACVDDGSYLLADGCAGAKFQTGGALFADTADVPPVLKADFSPSEPSGFDCKPAAWTKVKPKTDQASQQAHAACDTAGAPDSLSMNACFEGYAEPAEEVTIEFEETGKEDDFDSILTDELTEV